MEINNNNDLAKMNISPEQQTYILSLLQKQNNSQQLFLSQPTTSPTCSKELTKKNVNTTLKRKINLNDIDEIDNEEFIECVKKYSCLWNTALSSHKDYDKRKNAWEMINESLGGAYTDLFESLKKLWKGLRENFKRCNDRREKATRSGAALSVLPTCKYFKQLQFLTDTVCPQDTDSNLDSIVEANFNIEFQVEPTKNLSEQVGSSSSTDLQFNTKTCSNRNKKKAVNEIDTLLVESLKQLNKADNETINTDYDDLYCRSLFSRLKELPKKKNHLARIRIEEVLFTLEFEE